MGLINNSILQTVSGQQRTSGETYGTYQNYLWHFLAAPLGVFLQVGIGKHFWINIILTLCGYIPGIVHAVWVIAKKK